jgi:hypothetical protein
MLGLGLLREDNLLELPNFGGHSNEKEKTSPNEKIKNARERAVRSKKEQSK